MASQESTPDAPAPDDATPIRILMKDGHVLGLHPDDIRRIEWDLTRDGVQVMTLWLEATPKNWHSYEGVRVLGMSRMTHQLAVQPETGNVFQILASPTPYREAS